MQPTTTACELSAFTGLVATAPQVMGFEGRPLPGPVFPRSPKWLQEVCRSQVQEVGPAIPSPGSLEVSFRGGGGGGLLVLSERPGPADPIPVIMLTRRLESRVWGLG